jgi:lipid-A-disaccharide synthase
LSLRILLSCGEASGDLYAGALTRELHRLAPDLDVAGLGGPRLAAAGGRLLDDYRGLAATGVAEVIPKMPRYFAAMRQMTGAARRERPDVCVVIDFPDFNFRLAARLQRLGVPIVYYISPQIWAWRPGRMKTMRAIAERVLVIFPFEEPLYREAGVPVEFVGHPLVDLATPGQPRAAFLASHDLDPAAPTIALLPGSRPNEVMRILPVLLDAARLIHANVPDAQFVIARAPNLDDSLLDRAGPMPARTRIVAGDTDAVLASADLALTASGTATVQAALHDTPMVIVYRVSPWTYRLGRRFVSVDTFGMVNLLAGRRIVPELIQDAFTPAAVAHEALSLLNDGDRRRAVREGLREVRQRLGGGGASRRAAEAILAIATRKAAHNGNP